MPVCVCKGAWARLELLVHMRMHALEGVCARVCGRVRACPWACEGATGRRAFALYVWNWERVEWGYGARRIKCKLRVDSSVGLPGNDVFDVVRRYGSVGSTLRGLSSTSRTR
eukprot:6202707-Pleurochrysis_carterae.AAC.2